MSKPTEEDMHKLERLARYVRGSKELGIVPEASINVGVFGYIDASYGVLDDLKSHSGCVIGIGRGPL